MTNPTYEKLVTAVEGILRQVNKDGVVSITYEQMLDLRIAYRDAKQEAKLSEEG